MSDQLLMWAYVFFFLVHIQELGSSIGWSKPRICDKMIFLLFIYAQSMSKINLDHSVTWLNFLLDKKKTWRFIYRNFSWAFTAQLSNILCIINEKITIWIQEKNKHVTNWLEPLYNKFIKKEQNQREKNAVDSKLAQKKESPP